MPDSHHPDGLTPDVSTHLAEALRAVYGASPADFMAVRKELAAAAKADGDAAGAKAIGALRKPSTAAWAVNLLARQDPDLVRELVDLGVRMRGAQARLDTATLTSLRPERDRVVAAVVGAATAMVGDAGRTLSAAAQDDVRGTVTAALADEEASAAVTSGQLTRALSYSGFGEVDLSEAVVRTSSGSILSVVRDGVSSGASASNDTAEPSDDSGATAAERLQRAEAELEAATAAHAKAEALVAAAREHADDTRDRIGVVERQLAKAREADERALEAVTDAVRTRKAAEAARRTAQAELDRLRSATDD
ncbi:hypothetical protein ABEG17_07555 [Pedococcus sp. KACC 23699]|uniref:Transposase n=1 Tax=Pedococcus sp. KACC 23699 TaxID=3149228 RepID=A0AAU7JXN6_9MICO